MTIWAVNYITYHKFEDARANPKDKCTVVWCFHANHNKWKPQWFPVSSLGSQSLTGNSSGLCWFSARPCQWSWWPPAVPFGQTRCVQTGSGDPTRECSELILCIFTHWSQCCSHSSRNNKEFSMICLYYYFLINCTSHLLPLVHTFSKKIDIKKKTMKKNYNSCQIYVFLR